MRKACIAESGVDEKYLNMSRNGYLADVPEIGCYMLCIFEHSGMIEEDGTIHFGQVLHLFSPSVRETVQYVSNECQTKRKKYYIQIVLGDFVLFWKFMLFWESGR